MRPLYKQTCRDNSPQRRWLFCRTQRLPGPTATEKCCFFNDIYLPVIVPSHTSCSLIIINCIIAATLAITVADLLDGMTWEKRTHGSERRVLKKAKYLEEATLDSLCFPPLTGRWQHVKCTRPRPSLTPSCGTKYGLRESRFHLDVSFQTVKRPFWIATKLAVPRGFNQEFEFTEGGLWVAMYPHLTNLFQTLEKGEFEMTTVLSCRGCG